MPRNPSDRILYWPIVLAVACPLALILAWAGPFLVVLIGASVVLQIWIASALGAFAVAVVWVIERAWLRAASTLVHPIITAIAFMNIDRVWNSAEAVGAHLHCFITGTLCG